MCRLARQAQEANDDFDLVLAVFTCPDLFVRGWLRGDFEDQ